MKIKKTNLVQMTLRLHPDTIKEVKKIAIQERRNFNQMVNIILEDYARYHNETK